MLLRPIRTDEQREKHNKKVDDQQNLLLSISGIGFMFAMILEKISISNLFILVPMVLIAVFFPVGILCVLVLSFYKDNGMYEECEYRRYEQAKLDGDLNEDGTYKDHVL